jgi:hypothetical protein
MNEHLDEDLELYALGVLNDEERARVEAHAAACQQCSTRLGDAEAVVAKLALAYPAKATVTPMRLARIGSPWIAAAATFVLAVGITLTAVLQTHRLQNQLGSNDAVLATIATSHFNHTEFSKAVPGAPTAKVLYGRHGEWLYVIVDSTADRVHVIAQRNGAPVDFGSLHANGETATLFVRDPGTVARVDLQRDGTTIGTATPKYGGE